MLHRTRQLFIRQQTSVINAIRAHMAEYISDIHLLGDRQGVVNLDAEIAHRTLDLGVTE
jgi:transposase